MLVSRRSLLGGMGSIAGLSCIDPAIGARRPPHRFEATWPSLLGGFRAPDWFRDAKFGIWAHWGPQSVGQ